MNRIILVGNGLDLAHNIPTSYNDFINWYWDVRGNKMINSHRRADNDCLCSFRIQWDNYSLKEYYDDNFGYQDISGKEFIEHLKTVPHICEIKQTNFLKSLETSIETKGWVDIENEYYKILVSYMNGSNACSATNVLNEQLSALRRLLIEYLQSVQKNIRCGVLINEKLRDLVFSPIQGRDISCAAKKSWIDFLCYNYRTYIEAYPSFVENLSNFKSNIGEVKLFNDKYAEQIEYMGIDSVSDCDIPDDLARPEKTLFLNFNYTDWSDQYIPDDESRFFINHIHGSLSEPESIIFGYGDELDKDYEGLKNLNNNEYLRNMKSTKYLEADNYRKLLSFIDSAPFQIYIMGHSCGNSDRTLLNTLFEHDNCVSIKPFFHRKDDGSDNYLDIVQNISRNFTDMKKMRDRVVNKTYCEPLPQLKKAVNDNE